MPSAFPKKSFCPGGDESAIESPANTPPQAVGMYADVPFLSRMETKEWMFVLDLPDTTRLAARQFIYPSKSMEGINPSSGTQFNPL